MFLYFIHHAGDGFRCTSGADDVDYHHSEH